MPLGGGPLELSSHMRRSDCILREKEDKYPRLVDCCDDSVCVKSTGNHISRRDPAEHIRRFQRRTHLMCCLSVVRRITDEHASRGRRRLAVRSLMVFRFAVFGHGTGSSWVANSLQEAPDGRFEVANPGSPMPGFGRLLPDPDTMAALSLVSTEAV